MTEIEQLLQAARDTLKHWRKPSNEPNGIKSKQKTWQQLLDRPYGRMEKKY